MVRVPLTNNGQTMVSDPRPLELLDTVRTHTTKMAHMSGGGVAGGQDLDALKQAITPKTRMVIVNSPGNPTGAVFSQEHLQVM